MTKRSWKESVKAFGSHIDPEKEEELKWIKIEIENKVKRIAKLIKRINQGSREGNLRRRSELLQLVDEFHKQYRSIYSMYDNLRGEVRKKIDEENEGDSSSQSSSCSNSGSYYSTPEEAAARSSSSCSNYEPLDGDKQKLQSSDVEDAILKDKITSNIEVKETVSFDLENFETPTSFSQVSESGQFFKDLRIQGEEEEENSVTQKLIDESALLKEKVKDKEEEVLSLTSKLELQEKERLSQMKRLENQVANMKVDFNNLCAQKKELEEQIVCKSNELKQMEESNSGLLARVLELEATLKKKEDQFSHLLKRFKENQQNSKSKIEDLMAQSKSLQQEVDRLKAEKSELEQEFLHETKKGSDQVKDLTERTHVSQQQLKSLSNQKSELELSLEKKSHEASDKVKDLTERTNYLQQELEALKNQNSELELSLKEKTVEVSEYHLQMENLKEKVTGTTLSGEGIIKEKEDLVVQVKDLKSEVKSLTNEKSDLQEKIMDMNQEAYHSELQKEKLQDKMMDLETKLLGKEAELLILQKKFEADLNDISTQNSTLTMRLSNIQKQLQTVETEKSRLQSQHEKEKQESSHRYMLMEKKNTELTIKIAEQEKNLRAMEDVLNKSREEHKQMQIKLEDSKSNFLNAERKLEEMTEELRKTFEDSLRILSRRIRVAEQLHIENKEWYQKTRNSYEKENKDLKEKNARHEMGLRGIKDISLTASDMIGSLDNVALKFEECTAHFLNRISKVSCELKFVKDWVMRKNRAMAHVKDDFDCLLAQCDDKEAEILIFREKVWKSENKVRELEKTIKDKEDGMLVLKEEKREAIRQLCVWIDYHRSRSDYYKRVLLTEFGRRSTP